MFFVPCTHRVLWEYLNSESCVNLMLIWMANLLHFAYFSLDLSLVYELVELAVLYEKNTRVYHLSGLLAGILIHAWTRRQTWPSAGKLLPSVE